MILPRDPGAGLAGVATAVPPHVVDRETAATTLQRLFPDEDPAFVAGLVERSGVDTRHTLPSVEELLAPSDFTSRNRRYAEAAVELAEEASRRALRAAGVAPEEVDVLVDVSCTGLVIPALDVRLAPRLGLRTDVRRIPITESGCAAGALGLGLAASLAQTGLRVLVAAVELCSLTLSEADRTRTDLVSAVLFGDGAGAALVVPGGAGPRIGAVGSRLIPDTWGAMGFDVGRHGLRIRLRRSLPAELGSALGGEIDAFLASCGRERGDVGLHLVHPGGRRILEGYAELFGLAREELRHSFEALRRFGNLSSVSVLAVLELALEGFRPLPPGKEALLVGVGPGLSLELALLDWSRQE